LSSARTRDERLAVGRLRLHERHGTVAHGRDDLARRRRLGHDRADLVRRVVDARAVPAGEKDDVEARHVEARERRRAL
jgi:hypothetical protein